MIIKQLFKRLFSYIFNINTGGEIVRIKFESDSKGPAGEVTVAVFSRIAEVPNLGNDSDTLVAKAIKLFPNDVDGTLRLNWLKAIYKMRNNNIEWLMQPKTATEIKRINAEKPKFHKWNSKMSFTS